MTERAPTREGERRRIIRSFDVFGLSHEHRALIMQALDSDAWDWFADCDGCTCVSELHWPTKYFPPCLRHDFDWRVNGGGGPAIKRFYELQRAYGVPTWRSGLRSAGVTVSWYCWGFWRR